MNSMLEKEPKQDALAKKKKRDSMMVENIPPTTPCKSNIINNSLINIPNNTFLALALERKWSHTEKEKKSVTTVGFER